MKHNKDILKKIFLFSELNDEEISTMYSFCIFKNYSKNEPIFFDTEPYRGFYGLVEGLVKIYKISNEGREHIIHIVNPGNTFAEVPVFEYYFEDKNKPVVYPANASALVDDTEVFLIPQKYFLPLAEKTPRICFKFLSSLSKRLKHLNIHIENISLADVSRRLAIFLLSELNKSSSGIITLDFTKRDLASHLGTVTETLSRTFAKFQSEKIIEVKGKTILIKNPSKLKQYSII